MVCVLKNRLWVQRKHSKSTYEKGTIDPVINLETINEFSVLSTKDTIYNMSEGFYSSNLRVHDLYNKTLKDYDFHYWMI